VLVRDYVRVALPDFTGFPVNRIVELTPSNWAVRTHQVSKFDPHYLVYLKSDPAKEPIAVGDSVPGTLADGAHKTARPNRF
jgi:hypothetical protein